MMKIEFSIDGLTFFVSTIGFLLFVIALIWGLRFLLAHHASVNFLEKYKDKIWPSPLSARNKYPDVDVFRYRGPLINFGFSVACGIVFLAFSWTQSHHDVLVSEIEMTLEEIEIEIPIMVEEKPRPPLPPKVEEVLDEEIDDEEEPVFIDQSIEVDDPVYVPAMPKALPDAAPIPEMVEADVPAIISFAEEMPMFPGCEDELDEKTRRNCATNKLYRFIANNLKYPIIARDNSISGTCVIRFVVDTDGSISAAEIVRDIGAGCGAESLRVIELMNEMGAKWIPGKQRGRPVKVRYNLPIKFRLQD